MRILFLTFGLLAHNNKLMPWRTTQEVVNGMRKRGNVVDVISIVSIAELRKSAKEPSVNTIQRGRIADMRQELLKLLESNCYDFIYIPVSLSSNRLVTSLLKNIIGERIAYLPGSYFEFNQIFKIIGKMGFYEILPYIVQSLFPRQLFNLSLKQLSATVLIVNSEYSKQLLERYLKIPIISIPPGRDNKIKFSNTFDVATKKNSILIEPYFVFAGPPLPIRGIEVLLRAYLDIADLPKIPSLLCLFRSDSHLDIEAIKNDFETKWKHKKIIFCWESLDHKYLHLNIMNSKAVVMPFLIVPSEIPLAVYEAAAMGKTVITSGPHGTGDFVKKFGLTVSPGSIDELQKALMDCAQDDNKIISKQALNAYKDLDDWDSVSISWERILTKINKS